MALPSNSFSTYDAAGAKEDFSNKIWNVDPTETPFLSSIGKSKAIAKVHQWQTDVLDTPSDTNAQLEGDDHSGTAVTATTTLSNVCQIQKKDFVVTGTQDAIAKYGRGKETAYQKTLKKLALKNDIEKQMFANNAKVTGSESTAREMAGVPTWMTSNTDMSGAGSPADPTGDGTDARTDGTARAFTEAMLKTVLASIYDNSGKKPDSMYVGSFNKQAASAFVGATTRFDKSEDKKLVTSVDIYEYDFGSIKIVPSRHCRARDALILCTDMWEYAQLRPMFENPISKTGDNTKISIITEGTLVCRNEAANGIVADLTTS